MIYQRRNRHISPFYRRISGRSTNWALCNGELIYATLPSYTIGLSLREAGSAWTGEVEKWAAVQETALYGMTKNTIGHQSEQILPRDFTWVLRCFVLALLNAKQSVEKNKACDLSICMNSS